MEDFEVDDKENVEFRGKELHSLKRKHSNLQQYKTPTKKDQLDLTSGKPTPSGRSSSRTTPKSVLVDRRLSRSQPKPSPGRATPTRFSKRLLLRPKIVEATPDPNRSEQSSSDYSVSDDESFEEESEVDGEPEIEFQNDSVFNNQKISKSSTSNNTLNFRKGNMEEYLQNLANLDKNHVPKYKELIRKQETLFHQFKFELSQGFNLMFYGYGSKLGLMKRLASKLRGDTLSIKGFYTGLKMDQFLMQLQKILDLKKKDKQSILNHLVSTNTPLNLIINNFEAIKFDHQFDFLSYLGQLSCLPNVSLICTIDHLNSAVKYDFKFMESLNFIWHDYTNYTPYFVETSFETNLINQTEEVSVSGIHYVLKSLGQNAKQLLKILIKKQLEYEEDGVGISTELLFRSCREAFLVDNLVSFRTLLTEFLDHKIIEKKQADGQEVLLVPLAGSELSELLSVME